jgi:hypothetical protein
MGYAWELIISDDGSCNNTAKLVEGLGFANLNVVKALKNEGKGSAVCRGRKSTCSKRCAAPCAICCTFDATTCSIATTQLTAH